MKSITIHGLDDQINNKINEQAKRNNLSLNKTIKILLENALGLNPQKDHRDDFIEFIGVWSEKDVKEFELAIEDLQSTNSEDWK